MATFYLANNLRLGTQQLFAGSLINDAFDDTSKITAAGGVLLSSEDPRVVAAAKLAQKARLDGQPLYVMESLMYGAAAGAAFADSGGSSALSQAVWHVNALTGNDSNDGLTAGTALKTHAALEARIGHWNTLTSPAVDVFIDSDLPASDPINMMIVLQGGSQIIRYHGSRTTTRSGSITGFVARARATNTPYRVTDTGVANWVADVGQRVRITSGPATDGVAWVARDLGGNAARMSEFATVPAFLAGDLGSVTPVLPAVGNTYVVERLRRAFYGNVSVLSVGNDVANVSSVQFLDFEWQVADPTLNGDSNLVIMGAGTSTSAAVVFMGNKFLPDVEASTGEISYLNCAFTGSRNRTLAATFYDAGLALNSATGVLGTPYGPGLTLFDHDFMVQGADFFVQGGALPALGPVCVFDSPGDGFVTQNGGGIENSNAGLTFSGVLALWGSGNTGVGYGSGSSTRLLVAAGSTPTVTGTGGNIHLGGLATAQNYVPATGYAVAVAATWANVTALGDLHNPGTDSHILTAA